MNRSIKIATRVSWTVSLLRTYLPLSSNINMSDIRSLKPSEILYSCPSICNRNNDYGYIGEQLDKYYNERLSIHTLPRLQVFHQQDKWLVMNTGDMNQLLWIIHNLERLHKCHRITVEVVPTPHDSIFASNGVDIIGGPRGQWHKQTPHQPLKIHVQKVSQHVA